MDLSKASLAAELQIFYLRVLIRSLFDAIEYAFNLLYKPCGKKKKKDPVLKIFLLSFQAGPCFFRQKINVEVQ